MTKFQKEPKPQDEAGTRLYLRNQLVEAVYQALTSPGLAKEARREALQKLAASYGLLTRDVDRARKGQTIGATTPCIFRKRIMYFLDPV